MVEMTFIARDVRVKRKKTITNKERRLLFESFPVFRRGSRGFKAQKRESIWRSAPRSARVWEFCSETGSSPLWRASRQGAVGWRGARPDGDDRSVVGIHVPLTCYCELPAAPADNCHLSQGRRSQRDKPSLCLRRCLLLAPRSPASSPALNPGD